jgi:hypothetical protein
MLSRLLRAVTTGLTDEMVQHGGPLVVILLVLLQDHERVLALQGEDLVNVVAAVLVQLFQVLPLGVAASRVSKHKSQ